MTHEEMERAIDFVLQQQAKFASDMQQLTAFGSELARAGIRTEKKLAELAEAQKQTDARVAVQAAELKEFQKLTEAKFAELADRLNIFINVVEGHLSGNGKGQKPE